MTDPLVGLQSWYHKQCNDDWEHQYGVRIDTLDNPGWSLAIDLHGTALAGRSFRARELEGDLSWYVCKVEGEQFKAYCGPAHLGAVIQIFLSWATTT